MNRLDFGLIFKRSSCLNSTESKIDSERMFSLLENNQLKSMKLGRVNTSLQNAIDNYVDRLCNKENASQYWYRGLELIQKINENECRREADKLVDKYISRVLPYVENIGGVLEFLDRYNLYDDQENKIRNICEQFKLADKISNNHKQISKRFNIEYEVKSSKIKGLSTVVETCCSMIDTYSYEPYQKLNMSIEEMVYLFEKNNIDYRPDELLSSILEYFLLRSSELSDRDIKGYKFVMENNKCIDDMSASKFLFENFDVINIKSAINDYLKIQDKTPEITKEKFISIINQTSIDDIKNNIETLLDFLYTLYTSQTSQECGMHDMLESIISILYAVVDRYNYEAMKNNNVFRDDIVELIAIFERKMAKIPISNIEDTLTINKDGSLYYNVLIAFDKSLIESLDKMNIIKSDEDLDKYVSDNIKDDYLNGFVKKEYHDSDYIGNEYIYEVNNIEDVTTDNNISVKLTDNSVIEKNIFTKKDNVYIANFIYDLNNKYNYDKVDFKNTFTVNLPVKALTSNADKIINNGKTLVWNINNGEIKKINFEFTFNNNRAYISLGLIIVDIIIISIFIFIIIKRKKKNEKQII